VLTSEIEFNNHGVYKISFDETKSSGMFIASDIYIAPATLVTLSFWIYVPEEVILDSSVELHRHALPDGTCLNGSCHHYTYIESSNYKWDNSIERDKWIKKTITIKTHSDDAVVDGYIIRNFCYATGANPNGGYLYMTEPQIELSSYATLFTIGVREGIITDYSINDEVAILDSRTTPKWIEEKNNGYYEFDGETTSIKTPNIELTENIFTTSLWLKPNLDYSTTSRFLTPRSNGIDQFVAYDAYNERIYISIVEKSDTNTRIIYSPVGSVPKDSWSNIEISIDKDTIRIYINGKLEAESIQTDPIGIWNSYWTLGQRSNDTYYYKGLIDDFKIYKRVLSSDEIKYQYDMNKYKYE
jgi:hypothetical protein